VLERDISLGNYIDKAKKIYADLSSDLLIFTKNTPLKIKDNLTLFLICFNI